MKFKFIKYAVILSFVIFAGLIYSCEQNDGETLIIESFSEGESLCETEVNTAEGWSDEKKDDGKTVVVYVSGYVKNPGVYHLSEGSRIYEAIEMAGGFLYEADREYINLAMLIEDEQHIAVLSKEETATLLTSDSGMKSEGKDSIVNINTAGKEELMSLSGIGESRAKDIIAYRNEHGPFASVEEIMNVSGIKEGAFEKIKDYICIN